MTLRIFASSTLAVVRECRLSDQGGQRSTEAAGVDPASDTVTQVVMGFSRCSRDQLDDNLASGWVRSARRAGAKFIKELKKVRRWKAARLAARADEVLHAAV